MFKCILLWFALKLSLKETNTISLLCVYQMLTANPPKGAMTFQDVLLLHTQRTFSSLTNVIHTEEVVNVLARPPCWLSCNSLPWAQQTLAGFLPLSINEPSWTHLHMNCLTLFVIFSYSASNSCVFLSNRSIFLHVRRTRIFCPETIGFRSQLNAPCGARGIYPLARQYEGVKMLKLLKRVPFLASSTSF